MFRSLLKLSLILVFIQACSRPALKDTAERSLAVNFRGAPAQIEVGGPFVGIEMHGSSPLLNRISFFYPVANSIDVSTDYWKREQFRILAIGLKIGEGPRTWLRPEPMPFSLTPFSVKFLQTDSIKSFSVSYHFCKNQPAMVAEFELTNQSDAIQVFEIFTQLDLALRTSHSDHLKNRTGTEFDALTQAIYANFDDPETQRVRIFVANAGEQPASFTTNRSNPGRPGSSENQWLQCNGQLSAELLAPQAPGEPVAAFVYRKKLAPGQTLKIVQLIGSCRQHEGKNKTQELLANYQAEVQQFELAVLDYSLRQARLVTGEPRLDHSSHWAKAILVVNRHYLDGHFVPMPCPAEYNFYFTHDVLLTDLAAVNFDIQRVQADLKFIQAHANKENLIPHAYYWRDHCYVTEYPQPENWNHLWFVILSARYLRHSADIAWIQALYPLLNKSITAVLKNKKDDGLIWSSRPDWWDIGQNFGPRAYMTLLATQALRDFIYLSLQLNENSDQLINFEQLADELQFNLNQRLWDDSLKYLINFNADGSKDSHFYIGSLLANHFNLLDEARQAAQLQTAQKLLLDEKIGIYNACPMDFHRLINFYKFNGNEAGEPYYYMNGGIWPHGNAWYALALLAAGKKEAAFHFLKKTLTLDGIIDSPNGQPAMYECRLGNPENRKIYGTVDKPQFLWAGGWYLYCLYQLLGVRENEWNIAFDPFMLPGQKSAEFDLSLAGRLIRVKVTGAGNFIKRIRFDGQPAFTAVIPDEKKLEKAIQLELGPPEFPYVLAANSMLENCTYHHASKNLGCTLQAFAGHQTWVKIISPNPLKRILLNGQIFKEPPEISEVEKNFQIMIKFKHVTKRDELLVQF
ncbi:hypothetical protein L0128_13015 [candidate division KSB1 bacterium]|nr:hypothetical protein [candidate division KSB1 bacterium]